MYAGRSSRPETFQMRPNPNSASPVIVYLRQDPCWPLKSDNRSIRCWIDLLNQSVEDCLNQRIEAIKRSFWFQQIRVHVLFQKGPLWRAGFYGVLKNSLKCMFGHYIIKCLCFNDFVICLIVWFQSWRSTKHDYDSFNIFLLFFANTC